MSPVSKNSESFRLENISKTYLSRRVGFAKPKLITVLDDISLSIQKGEVLCIVGESGCGKTTLGKILAGAIKPSQGTIFYDNQNIWETDKQIQKSYRKKVQMILQDPYTSLNPMQKVLEIILVPLLRHKIVKNKKEGVQKVKELLKLVGLTPEQDFIDKYPHQLSGGQRQRVAVARTLTVNPEFIVADEAVSMLDVSVRLNIINLLMKLKEELGISYFFITHDLAIANYFGRGGRIAVMYLGKIVELGPTSKVIENPRHPYTQILLAALPEADPVKTRHKTLIPLRSLDVPSLLNLPSGCKFHPRCPVWLERKCDQLEPKLEEISENHFIACYNPQKPTVL